VAFVKHSVDEWTAITGQFIARRLKDWREANRNAFARVRQRRKNGNAHVEQKNGDAARKTAGYGRIAGSRPSTTFSTPTSTVPAIARSGKTKTPCLRSISQKPFPQTLEPPDSDPPSRPNNGSSNKKIPGHHRSPGKTGRGS
jgi:hypothetical protein